MTNKRMIFTVTTGRTGTGYLANLLGVFQHTITFHEPDPSYVHCMRQAQADRGVARSFLLETKLPAIEKVAAQPIYVETTHLMSKGFLEPWLEIPGLPVPDLILLNRNPRQISLSYLELGAVPGRTEKGLEYLLAPWDQTNLTMVADWESLNDYQLVYWYCLEVEARKKHYQKMVTARGGRACSTSVKQLKSLRGMLALQKQLALPPLTAHGWLAYLRRRDQHVNTKAQSKHAVVYAEADLVRWESEVSQRIRYGAD